jgi:hypothetical protein
MRLKITISLLITVIVMKLLSPAFWDHYWFHSTQIASVGLTLVIGLLSFIMSYSFTEIITIKIKSINFFRE